jgi:epoxyqueuosine reductase
VKAKIRQRARELGFEACHFTTADPPQSSARFQEWLDRQYHGNMAYLQRNAQKRIQPDLVLSGAKSVIVLAASYEAQDATTNPPRSAMASANALSDALPDQSAVADRQRTGVVARYARFTDYHDVLGRRLRELTAFVDQTGGRGTRSLWYVDTGPFLERDLAQRAGLGFIGKHTNLISRRFGNWIFLAEIITTLELKPDTPEKNRCGSCTRCIIACPTRAITAPFQLDARRCISYLTIEHKGSIPLELRPAIGNRIYGCDDCLAVCPWNRFAQDAKLMKPHARADLVTPDLVELLSLDQAAFRHRFAGTPIMRTKRRGLLRNVCVALGNVGDVDALPALGRSANDAEPLIAEHARWAIEQIAQRQHRWSIRPAIAP